MLLQYLTATNCELQFVSLIQNLHHGFGVCKIESVNEQFTIWL